MTLHQLNILPQHQLTEQLFKCCGSITWVNKMLPFFPAENVGKILQEADEQWWQCTKEDWLQAFTHHPKIGDVESLKNKFASTSTWAAGEQSGASTTSQKIIEALAKGNIAYENKFGFIFIVCATGKSADEMLQLLQQRLPNNITDEIKIAAEEQNKITKLRIEKLLD